MALVPTQMLISRKKISRKVSKNSVPSFGKTSRSGSSVRSENSQSSPSRQRQAELFSLAERKSHRALFISAANGTNTFSSSTSNSPSFSKLATDTQQNCETEQADLMANPPNFGTGAHGFAGA